MSITRTLKKVGENYQMCANGAYCLCPFQANYSVPVKRNIKTHDIEMQNLRYGCGTQCPLFEASFKSTEVDVTINCGAIPVEYRGLVIEEQQQQPGPKIIR